MRGRRILAIGRWLYSLLRLDDFLSPWREEVEDVMMSGAAVRGVPGGIHMLWGGGGGEQ